MDDFIDENCIIEPYTGPIISVPDYKNALCKLSENTKRMRISRKCNRPYTRRLLLEYLSVCDTLQYASSSSILEEATKILVCHALAIPAGALTDNLNWPAIVLAKLIELDQPACDDCAGQYRDSCCFAYFTDGSVRVLDYFGCRQEKSILAHFKGTISERYEQCSCGRWMRHLTVF